MELLHYLRLTKAPFGYLKTQIDFHEKVKCNSKNDITIRFNTTVIVRSRCDIFKNISFSLDAFSCTSMSRNLS